jgi:hypothetical protein
VTEAVQNPRCQSSASTEDFYNRLGDQKTQRAGEDFKAKQAATEEYNRKFAELDRDAPGFERKVKGLRNEMEMARHAGHTLDPAAEDKFHRLDFYSHVMAKVRETLAGVDDQATKNTATRYINGLARAALGDQELATYPNPLAHRQDAPPPVRQAAETALRQLLATATEPKPQKQKSETQAHYTERLQKHDDATRRAIDVLGDANLTYQDARKILNDRERGLGKRPMIWTDNGEKTELGHRLDRLSDRLAPLFHRGG